MEGGEGGGGEGGGDGGGGKGGGGDGAGGGGEGGDEGNGEGNSGGGGGGGAGVKGDGSGSGGGVTGEGGGSTGRQQMSFHVCPVRLYSSAYSLPPGHEFGSVLSGAGVAQAGHGRGSSLFVHMPHAPPRMGRQQLPASHMPLQLAPRLASMHSVCGSVPATQRGNWMSLTFAPNSS